jgi:hypothetical protein
VDLIGRIGPRRSDWNRGELSSFFLDHLWPVIAVWSVLYISDHTLTVWCARLRLRGASEKIVHEGSYELNPVFQREVDALQWISFRFLLAFILTNLLLILIWLLDVQSSSELHSFVLGAFVCIQLAIHVRHLRNLFVFSAMIGTDTVRGRIEYSRSFILRTSAVEFLAFSGLYAVLFLFTRSWFVIGGVFACLLLAGKHWWLARRHVAGMPLV